MNTVTTNALAWTLIHFVWQGALIALLLGLANATLRNASAAKRYAVSCAALILMLAAPAATFMQLSARHRQASQVPAQIVDVRTAQAASAQTFPAAPTVNRTPDYLPWLVRLWLAGVILLTLRSAVAWLIAQRLKRSRVKAAPREFERIVRRLCQRLAISRTVRLLESAIAEVPSVIGWIRPVILLPVSTVTALSPGQIEYLLAHELAHIRRHDYLINLIQTAVETALFYHPAVWWVSAQIRLEREHCCDDLAVEACGDALDYARALAQLEELRGEQGMAMAANGGSLLVRIQRLAGRDVQRPYAAPVWLALPALAAVLIPPATVLSETPPAKPASAHTQPRREGFLAGLADAQYTAISVDDIIALKQNGVDPQYIKELKNAGLGTPKVEEVIKLHGHGVGADFAAAVVKSGLVRDLNFDALIRLKENGADPADMGRVRGLGFGPFATDDVCKLRNHGVDAETFEALKEGGYTAANAGDAMELKNNGLNAETMRAMKNQGFNHLTLAQVIKLHRAGII